MPEIILNEKTNTQNLSAPKKQKSNLQKVADWTSGLESVADMAALYGPASIIASPVGATLGSLSETLRYFDNEQSGLDATANILNKIGWGALGVIPGLKEYKLASRAKVLEKLSKDSYVKTFKEAEKIVNDFSKNKKPTKAQKNAYNKAIETVDNLKNKKIVKEYLQLTEDTKQLTKDVKKYKPSTKKQGETYDKILNRARLLGFGVGRTAISGGMTYGIPGIGQYIEENNDSEFVPGSVFRALGVGAIGNGFSEFGLDVQDASNDWGAAARLVNTFVLPNSGGARKMIKKYGGKLNTLKILRNG